MSRKQDVIILFEFLIELLKEKEVVVDKPTIDKIPVVIDESKKPLSRAEESKNKLEQLINPEEVRHLIQRVEELDKPVFVNPILGDQQRNFETEFKKMVKQVDELTKEKEVNDKNTELDFTAESDFNIIREGRKKNITTEEREAIRPQFDMNSLLSRHNNEGISFSG